MKINFVNKSHFVVDFRGYLTRKKVKPRLEEFRRSAIPRPIPVQINISGGNYGRSRNSPIKMNSQQQQQQNGIKFVAERMKMYQSTAGHELANLSNQVQIHNQDIHRQLRLQRHCASIESLAPVPDKIEMPPRLERDRTPPVNIPARIRDSNKDTSSYPTIFHDISDAPLNQK